MPPPKKIETGVAAIQDKKGNDAADAAASSGVAAHGIAVVEAMHWLREREQSYTDLVHGINQMAVAAIRKKITEVRCKKRQQHA